MDAEPELGTALDEKRSQGMSEVEESCSTVLSSRSPSVELIREAGGSPDLSECSELFNAFQTCRHSLERKPIGFYNNDVKCFLEAWPDSSSSIPAFKALDEKSLQGKSEVQESCSTVLSSRSPSVELIREAGGSPDLSDECSELFNASQTCRNSLERKPIRFCYNGAESPVEAWPDTSSSIPAFKALDEKRSQGMSEVQESCSSVLSTRSPSVELIREAGGSPDLSEECSDFFNAFQTCRHSLERTPIRFCNNGAESPLEAWPDTSSSIPAFKALDEKSLQGMSEVQESCSTILSSRSPSVELIREGGGCPDLSEECSELFNAFQTCRYSLERKPIRFVINGAESPLEAWPDTSSSMPAFKVNEATCVEGDSEDSDEEEYDSLEVPTCPDGTTDSTRTTEKKWKKLRNGISSFLRRVFCCGCLPSQRVVPL
ncbi:hypothetical protein SRHO_G00031110 [Serrasalmus rhombeus]